MEATAAQSGWLGLLRDLTIYLLFILAAAVVVYGLSEFVLWLGDLFDDAIFDLLQIHLPQWAKPFRRFSHGLWQIAPLALDLAETHPRQALLVAALSIAALWVMYRLSRVGKLFVCFLTAALGWFLFVWGMRALALALAQLLGAPFGGVQPLANTVMNRVDAYFAQVGTAALAGDPVAMGVISATGLLVLLLVVALLISAPTVWRLLMELVRYVQNEIQGLFVGAVHPAFPRRPEHLARKLARDRRLAIDHFLASRRAPDLRRQVRFSPGDIKNVRKHVDERTVEEEGPPELVTAFLERPKASTISLERRAALEEGAEEAVGQYVRLMHERQQLRDDRHWWLRLWGEDRYEDLIVPLLARVVDAAVLADRFIDEQRRETQWNALPFYDRIWAEYRPMPFPFSCLLRPVFGNGLPIRVVIETQYSDAFLRAMFGGALPIAAVHANWFGIGIQIEKADQPQDFMSRFVRRYFGDCPPFRRALWPWPGTQRTRQCRRLKAHTLGVLSPQIDVTFKTPRHRLPPDPTPENWSWSPASDLVRRDAIRLMPTTCLADGCPSIVRPRPFPLAPSETASTSPVMASRTTLARRGSVSNAPAVSLMPSEGFRLFPDCGGVCLPSMPPGIQTVEIERDTVTYTDNEYASGVRPGNVSPDIGGDVHQMIPLLPRRYWGPSGELLHRRVWIGAFYDSELRIANRFPLFGCKFTYGDYSRMSGTMKDLGGGVAKPVHAPLWLRLGAPDPNWRPFGGLFVSTHGPRFAANLLLPEPLLCDYLKHLSQHEAVIAATRLAADDELPFVPLPEDLDRKAR